MTVHSVKEQEAGGLYFSPHSIANGLIPVNFCFYTCPQKERKKEGRKRRERRGFFNLLTWTESRPVLTVCDGSCSP